MYDLGSNQPGKRKLAVLIDPDKTHRLEATMHEAIEANVDFFLVGGSLVSHKTDRIIEYLKEFSEIPVLLFPGSMLQLSYRADAILLLSLISGRNPEYLIGQHVQAAYFIKENNIPVIPTSYILIESGKTTSVAYMSNTQPIPADKPDIVAATALAGEQLGHKLCYLEGGSGAPKTVSEQVIHAVSNLVGIPVWVGGGIKTAEQAKLICQAGASGIIIGTIGEETKGKILEISAAVRQN